MIIAFIYWGSLAVLGVGLVAAVASSYEVSWKWVLSVGFVGHLAAYNHIWGVFRRERPTVKRLHEQLLARTRFPVELWGSPQRAELAEFAAKTIAAEIEWPNPYLIPDDPMEILLFFPWGDGAQGLVISFEMEKKYGEIGKRRPKPWRISMTFGEFVDCFDQESAA